MTLDTITQLFNGLLDQFIDYLPNLLLAILIFILSLLLSKGTSKAVQRALKKAQKDPEITLLMGQLSRWGILILGSMLALDQISDNITSLIAGLGITGFALGFALQDIAKNFIAGILLLLQQPFDIGDAIEVGDFGGTVTNITLRMTEISTWDGRNVQIPNADVYISPIINFSRSPLRRIQITIRVAANADLELAARISRETITALPELYQEKPAMIAFTQISNGTVDLNIHFWVDTRQHNLSNTKDSVIRTLNAAFQQAHIPLPIPLQSLDFLSK